MTIPERYRNFSLYDSLIIMENAHGHQVTCAPWAFSRGGGDGDHLPTHWHCHPGPLPTHAGCAHEAHCSLLGKSTSNGQYITHVRIRIPTFDGCRPANFQFWHNSLLGVVQREQLTPTFIGQIMINAPLSSGKAYRVIIYSRFIREAEARRLTLIPSDATPASWADDEPEDAYDTRLEAIQPRPPSTTSLQTAISSQTTIPRRGGPAYPMAPPPPPLTTYLSSRPSSPQRSAASSSSATSPLSYGVGSTPSSSRAPAFTDWAGVESTLVGQGVDFSESTLSSQRGPGGP
jgi:hypothetical protein